MTPSTDADRQLELIAEVLDMARELRIEIWLRGGWAMDFFLGRVSREHGDVDWFAWAEDAPTLAAAFTARDFVRLAKAPAAQQLDYSAGDVELSIAFLARDPDGHVLVAGGPWAGARWPTGMLDTPAGRLRDLTCPIISPEAQIEIKLLTPSWMPNRPRRAKDAEDIDRLRAALAG
ncbi:nucleotidyltransferase domain-containing protein [Embleya sp. NBC_00896]|uniref:nucleotidyltransferase domain-containing protein n=1 Tax=Embleya sp. NBC_00896 TaxID=2975961 RepID=UPI002F917D5C|nr:aminoglycoside adenylyltransferase [Embleya sp. NBC_00896]